MYGNRIRQLRKERKMTAKELGEQLGIPVNTMGNYERGDREPSVKVFVALADYFNVSLDYLIGRTEKRTAEEYFFASDSDNLQALLKEAPLEVRKVAAQAYENMYFFASSAISLRSITELERLNQILNFLFRMKNDFPNSKFAMNGFAPVSTLEGALVYIEEKNELDKVINELFKFYEQSRKNEFDNEIKQIFNERLEKMLEKELKNFNPYIDDDK